MSAYAAEAGTHAAPFYLTPEFWVLVAFIIFIAAAGPPLWRRITGMLDERAQAIRDRIEEATKLRDEAQALLSDYERKHRAAVAEAQAIVGLAREEAERMSARAVEELERSLKRRERLAHERIEQAEAKAIDEVKARAIDVALEASRRVLTERVTGAKADALVDAAIKELPKKLAS
ncbi:MAG: F0F1 ATP synthase subunit B [Rhodospirillales bacterium]|nr:F0F1 ATP synthase subunit B [Rhodospirillales bacterium]